MEDLEGGSWRAGKSQREENTQLKGKMSQNTGLVTWFNILGTKGGGGGVRTKNFKEHTPIARNQ